MKCSLCGGYGSTECKRRVCEFRTWTYLEDNMAHEDAIMVKSLIPEWAVEVSMTVLKYINAGSKEEAEAAALEDDDFVRVMEKQITNLELITK
jgi:hypothetical protein